MTKRNLHRRDFLKMLGAGAALLPGVGSAAAFGSSRSGSDTASFYQTDVVESEASMIETLRRDLETMFEGREMGLDFRRIDDDGTENFHIAVNNQEYYPVASAFKVFLVLHYFINTPADEWDFAPTSSVYRVAVYSNNGETGNLIWEMGERVEGDGNPIEKFNDFIINTLHLEHGLYSWNWPNTPTVGYTDERFLPTEDRQVHIRSGSESLSNISTAADLAKGWEFIARADEQPQWEDEHFQQAIRATREILAIPAPGYLSPLEQVLSGGYIGKDGTLPLGDIKSGRVINDAGIVRVPTAQYLISFMSTGENESTTKPALQRVVDGMRMYEAQYHPSGSLYISGESHPLYEGYNYGFVRRQQINLYSQPDINSEPVDNPVRRNTVFGMMYLMQGALVRFEPVNDEWGRLIKDDDMDDVFQYTDWSAGFEDANWHYAAPPNIYMRIEDLLVIGNERSEAIGYVTGAPEGTDKYIILDVPRRQLTLFEGAVPIIKTPVVLNMDATPRGRLYVNRKLLARNMPHYPGVPYTNFLHDGGDLRSEGFALHGAPWHRWSETVTRRECLRRYSHGCINLPNWEREIGDMTIPVDEFVFRWMGGFPNPQTETHWQHVGAPVRVYSHNNVYSDVFEYTAPESVLVRGGGWNDVLHELDAKTVDAPSSFFEPTLL